MLMTSTPFNVVVCHLELEEDRLASLGVKVIVNLATSSSNCKLKKYVTKTSYKGKVEKKKTT